MIKGVLPPSARTDFPSENLLNEIKAEDLRNLVKKMLVKEPKERLSAKEVLNFLKN
jgi:hypothetical protein